MSALQQRPHGPWVGGLPEPEEADHREDERGEGSHRSRGSDRPSWRPSAQELLRYGSLVVLAWVLLAGYWKPHPIPSLALPAVALMLWWPELRGRRPERWLFFYVAGIYLYTVLRAYADDAGMSVQAQYVIAFDRVLFLGNVPTVELQRALFTPWRIDVIDLLAVATHWSFFVVPHAMFALLWFRRRSLAAKYAAAMLITLYAGLLLFWLAPTVPPWLAARQGDLSETYRVMNFVTRGIDVDAYRELYGTMAGPNAVASVPSIHMALTFLVLLAARDTYPRLTWPLVGYNVVMAFSLVYLGEHYVFDLMVGMLIASVAYYALRVSRSAQPVPGVNSAEGVPALVE